MSEKPLHVRVAEALGETPEYRLAHSRHSICHCDRDAGGFPWPMFRESDHMRWEIWHPDPECPHGGCQQHGDWKAVERYDLDWRVTGPLIERYGVEVSPYASTFDKWRAEVQNKEKMSRMEGAGPTPLTAVCELIWALGRNGQLEEVRK